METGEKAPSSPGGDEQLAAVAVTCYGLTSSEQRGGRRPSEPGSGQSDTGLSDSSEIQRYRVAELQRGY